MNSLKGLAVTLCFAAACAAAEEPPVPAMTASAVMAAASAVAADPLLPGKEKTKSLRFKRDDSERDKKPGEADDARWFRNMLESFSFGMRIAVWLVGAALLIWVLLRLRDWVKGQSGDTELPEQPPTHVGTLDIRPESLPADIGSAARALWHKGRERAALSLLYRGALSRLVHGHGVPIRAASTESECLALAAKRLAAAPQAFLVQLVTGWQTVAYAQRKLPAERLEALCQGFDEQLPAARVEAAA